MHRRNPERAARIPPRGTSRDADAAAFGTQRLAVIGVWIVMAAAFGVAEPKLFIRHGTFSTIFGSQQPLVFSHLLWSSRSLSMSSIFPCLRCLGSPPR